MGPAALQHVYVYVDSFVHRTRVHNALQTASVPTRPRTRHAQCTRLVLQVRGASCGAPVNLGILAQQARQTVHTARQTTIVLEIIR